MQTTAGTAGCSVAVGYAGHRLPGVKPYPRLIARAFDVTEKAELCEWLNGIGPSEGSALIGPPGYNLQPAIHHLIVE
ncbi:MAG: hypothetical protein PVH80_01120 [Anaerolineae bacterium]